MATIQKRKSHGQNYWYIVESRRINGKPRPVTLAYLGKAEDLLQRLNGLKKHEIKSYSHGDTMALLNLAKELNIIDIINEHVPLGKDGKKPVRDNLTVGASFLLAAIGRSCHPTSKMGWYDWCRETSLEYVLSSSFSKLDSQHFWDQMSALPENTIPQIEEKIIKKLIEIHKIKFDCLFFDTTNFFTFIASDNDHCEIPKRGHNKQKRVDLRQIGMALLASRKEQLPLFHRVYEGNKNDFTVFKEVFNDLSKRLKSINQGLSDITLVFDKGNNTKENFKKIDDEGGLYYVAGLVSAHFKDLIAEANANFQTMKIDGEEVPVYRIKKPIWGNERTCVITISKQLKEGQIQGIEQHLEKKYKILNALKQQLENPRRQKDTDQETLKGKLDKIIQGQFIEEILKYDFIALENNHYSFTYSVDNDAFTKLKNEVLGRKILTTNRHSWSNEEICLAYKGQSKVEYAFRNMKNPYHMAIRPQYHWTDQKIKVHFLICIIGYLLTAAIYSKVKNETNYKRNMHNLMEDLRTIRLSGVMEMKEGTKGLPKVNYIIEKTRLELEEVLKVLKISDQNLKQKLPLVVYK